MKILITENKFKEVIFDSIKEIGIKGTFDNIGGFDNYCSLFKIKGPMDFLKSLPLMDVVESEERPDWSLFRYKKGNNMMIYDRENEDVNINHNEIWEFLESKFGLKFKQIQDLTKKWLDEVYKLRGVTTNCRQWYDYGEESLKLTL